MFKAGWVMLISSVLIVIGWTIYILWQAGRVDSIIGIICTILFIGGIVMIVTSKDFGL